LEIHWELHTHKVLGVNLNQLKLFIIAASSLLSASITAFLGPILFIGIIVPHFSRLIYNPAKLWQQWILNMMLGMLMMLFSPSSQKKHRFL
jgi:iron complex transport system permease protein